MRNTKEAFQKTGVIEESKIPQHIVESWKRSYQCGVMSDDPSSKTILSATEIRQRISKRQSFYNIALYFRKYKGQS